jgi:hypothetical protein
VTVRFYPAGLSGLLSGAVAWEDIRALLLSPAFVYDAAAIHADSIDPAFVIARSELLEEPSFDGGLASGLPLEFQQLLDTRLVEHVVFFQDVGDDSYSPLLVYYGPSSLAGVPFIPEGLDYFVYPVSPPGGFFRVSEDPIVGTIASYPLADALSLGELGGGVFIETPRLYVGGRLNVRDRICLTPEEIDNCCRPTIRSSRCA